MKNRRRIIHTTALLASSLAAMAPGATLKAQQAQEARKARVAPPNQPGTAAPAGADALPDLAEMLKRMARALSDLIPSPKPANPVEAAPIAAEPAPAEAPARERYPWRNQIVTTTFWIGEKPSKNNPVPNCKSSWDKNWAKNYGGTDNPDPKRRVNYHPDDFIPNLNPFYIALPYNDLIETGHKPEAASVIPWFKQEFKGRGISVLKGRWIAIRHKERIAYAQWEDCGPFRTDFHEYVFGDRRPNPKMNKGVGLDVSPAVRDFLGMKDTDITDWRFVELDEVPDGPWKRYGENNHFVRERRERERKLAMEARIRAGGG